MMPNNETPHVSGSLEMRKRRRYRKPISCQPCRHRKLRCDRQSPCTSCKRRSCVAACKYVDDVPSAFTDTEPNTANLFSPLPALSQLPESFDVAGVGVSQASSPPVIAATYRGSRGQSNQSFCADFVQSHWDTVLQRPIEQMGSLGFEAQDPFCQLDNLCFPFSFGPKVSTSELIAALPSRESSEYLVTQYFARISPFFHILHGPTFQKEFTNFSKDPANCDLSWLALLFLICSATINTMDDNDTILADITSQDHQPEAISHRYRIIAMICLCQDNFLIRHRLSTLEALLIFIYTISHNEGVDRSWALLGIALNIGIALQCNAAKPSSNLNTIDVERRRRCWAGILMLHTYQTILFQDIDMSSLMNNQGTMPADVNDTDILEDKILQPTTHLTHMSIIKFKISLFQLSARINKEVSGEVQFNEVRLEALDADIASEQRKWASTFLVDGEPSLLDSSSYALWCGLEIYAHQLYLLLHRPFSRRINQTFYRQKSRQKCIVSSAALLDIHRKWVELPRLRIYRWYANGMIGSCAFHGAVTLASCLLEQTEGRADISTYRTAFDAAVLRFDKLQKRSTLYVKAYPILRHLQTMLSPEQSSESLKAVQEFGNNFDDWIDNVRWLAPESIDWDFWNEMLNSEAGELLS